MKFFIANYLTKQPTNFTVLCFYEQGEHNM